MAELRPLGFSLFTLVFFFLLTSLMSPSLYVFSDTYALDSPDAYQGADIGDYQFVHNVTVEDANFDSFQALRIYHFELGGQYWTLFTDSEYTYLRLGRRNYFGIFLISYDFLDFRHESGTERGNILTGNEMNLDYASDEDWIKYRMYNPSDPAVGCELNLGFNTSEYSSPKEALEDQELVIYVGMGIDDVYSALNGWQLVVLIMFFQLPNIDPIVNAFIAIPLWFFFALPLVLLILEFLPFVGGS